MSIDMKLVQKGKGAPRDGLLDQARAHLELEKQHRAALADRGWTPELTQQLVGAIALVGGELGSAIEARTASKASLEREHAAVADAKAYKRRLVLAADDLHADGLIPADVHHAIRGGGALGRSAVRISGYLAAVGAHVRANDGALGPYFKGESAAARLDVVKAELDAAEAAQETDYAALPDETQRIYEAKGRLLALIEKMNRLGKLAFDGDAQTIARFNKDLILRARKTRSTQATEAEAEPSEA